jgi:hypothetical protein
MARAHWPLRHDRPIIQVVLTLAQGGHSVIRYLLADTGAGTANSGFDLLLEEQDCLLCGGNPAQGVALGGAYTGSYPIYLVQIRIPLLGVDEIVPVVGIPTAPVGFDGIACFQLLNRFAYGNFAVSGQFGLEI